MVDIKNLKEKENILFGRKEISFEIDLEKAPSKEEVLDLISKKFSKDKVLVKIEGIYGGFGSKNFEIRALIYNSKESYEKSEGKLIEEKKEPELDSKELETKEEIKEEEKEEIKKETKEDTKEENSEGTKDE